jgi:hypothetical protein
MFSIYQLVNKTLKAGYLSVETEGMIRDLFDICCNQDDIEALIMLQMAVESGCVRRQVHEMKSRDCATTWKMA